MSPAYRYRYAGLEIASWMPLPELDPGRGGTVDVNIVRASVPPAAGTDTDVGFHANLPDGCMLEIAHCARFAVTGGNTVAVELLGDPAPQFVRLYLLGSVFGALAHQRSLVPLHAGAIALGGGAVALVGRSGAGKSTLTALLADAGAQAFLCDDVCPLTVSDDGDAMAWPGVARVRLSEEAWAVVGGTGNGFEDQDPFGKRARPPPWPRPHAALPLQALLVLGTQPSVTTPRLRPATPRELLAALLEHTYRPGFMPSARRAAHLRACAALARRLPAWHLTRTWGLARARSDASGLLEALRASLADALGRRAARA